MRQAAGGRGQGVCQPDARAGAHIRDWAQHGRPYLAICHRRATVCFARKSAGSSVVMRMQHMWQPPAHLSSGLPNVSRHPMFMEPSASGNACAQTAACRALSTDLCALVGLLYDPSTELICGLRPAHFITLATPHLGCADAAGPAQVFLHLLLPHQMCLLGCGAQAAWLAAWLAPPARSSGKCVCHISVHLPLLNNSTRVHSSRRLRPCHVGDSQ